MNKHDFEIIKMNWDRKREQLRDAKCAETMDVSSSCYVIFGTYGFSYCKYKNGRWQRKIVNDWKSLDFDEFIKRCEAAEWERL